MDVKGLFHVVDGKLLVRDVEVATVDQLFYGTTVKQTDDAQSYPGVTVLTFNSGDFYVTQNTGNTDEAIINSRLGPAGAPGTIQFAGNSFDGRANFK